MDADLTPILEDLASGRIDAVEANKRIGLAHQLAAQATARAEAERLEGERRAAEQELKRSLDEAERVAAGAYDVHDAPGSATPPGDATRSAQEAPKPAPSWADLARGLAGAATELAGSAVRTAAATVTEQVANARTQHVPNVPSAHRPAGSQGIERVAVHTTGRQVRIIADSSIGTVAVDGPHRRERNGSTLEIHSESELGGDVDVSRMLKGFSLADVPRLLRGELGADDLKRLATGKPVVVRVNPAIVVDIEASGGSVHVDDVAWLGRVRITAGTAHLTGVSEIEDALVQAATVTVGGRFDGPRSRVRVESGRLKVQLDLNADVTVAGTSSLGRIAWPVAGEISHRAGLGTGRLDLVVTLGQVTISDARETATN